MITEKRERPRSISLTVEDVDSQVTVIISTSSDRSILDKARSLFLDQVVCIEVSRTQGEFLLAHDFFNPDIPDKPRRGSEEEIYAAFLSDLHVGSQKFMSTSFNQFLKWLNGESRDLPLNSISDREKYLVIAGDIVDGIGVYPGQERELEIRDIHKQYAEAAKLLAKVPSYVEIILIPGNHDATLQAIPQPSISRDYAEQILNQDNVTSLGNPAMVKLHGVDVTIYHGQSLNDVIGTIPGVTYQNLNENITKTMRSLVKARHLAPTYGGRTPIIPQIQDHLVIENPPSILHCGHLHVAGYEMYRGTLLLNSGTWQSQTEYQERMGIVPTPGIAPIVNLKTLAVLTLKY
jgi:DNA polymerase II small subunit